MTQRQEFDMKALKVCGPIKTVTVLKVEASAMLEQCRKQEPILAGFPANSLEGLETFELSESWEVLAAEV